MGIIEQNGHQIFVYNIMCKKRYFSKRLWPIFCHLYNTHKKTMFRGKFGAKPSFPVKIWNSWSKFMKFDPFDPQNWNNIDRASNIVCIIVCFFTAFRSFCNSVIWMYFDIYMYIAPPKRDRHRSIDCTCIHCTCIKLPHVLFLALQWQCVKS